MKKVIINNEELYSFKGSLMNQEDIKNSVISDFTKEFIFEVQKLIDKKGKDEVLGICKRK